MADPTGGYVTKALLLMELEQLKKQYQQLINDGNATLGAIQFAEHLLKTISGETIISTESETALTDA